MLIFVVILVHFRMNAMINMKYIMNYVATTTNDKLKKRNKMCLVTFHIFASNEDLYEFTSDCFPAIRLDLHKFDIIMCIM
jgi:hypothetical protein